MGSHQLHCHLIMDIIKHFWYLIHVKRQKEMVTIYTLTSQLTPMKTIRTTIVSAIYRQIGSCFGLFDIAGQTQYTCNVDKYKINFHSLGDMLEKRVDFLSVSKAQSNLSYVTFQVNSEIWSYKTGDRLIQA